jgi:hypothetical protein
MTEPEPTTTDPVTHDYGPGRRCWGHDFTISRVIDNGQQLHASGWGPALGRQIRTGDYLLLEQSGGRTTRYRVQDVTYSLDPTDMWHATLTFAPRRPVSKD